MHAHPQKKRPRRLSPLLTALLLLAIGPTATITIGACSDEVSVERSNAECSDNKDNDGDGRIDCLDPDCRGRPICGAHDGAIGDSKLADETIDDGGRKDSAPIDLLGTEGSVDDANAKDLVGPTRESEPNDGNTKTEFNAIHVPDMILGAIEKANDSDVFRFPAQAGDRLSVRATSTGGAELHVAVFGEASLNVPPAVNTFGHGKNALAEYYILKSGTYFIALRDRRNIGATPAGVGDPSFTYTIVVTTLSRAPLAIALGMPQATTIDPAGTVRVLSFSAQKEDTLEVRTTAKGLTPASDVDTRLSLFFPGQKAWLGTNDNPSLGVSDSLLKGKMPFSGTYHVIVENVADSGTDLRVEVAVSKTP